MPNHSTVTVIIPVYNGKTFLRDALQSVLMQTYPPAQIVVIDDGSVDGSYEILKAYGNRLGNQFTLLTHPNHQNRGLTQTYLLGLKNAYSEYIAFLEQDDYWRLDNLERKVAILDKYSQVGAVFSDVKPITPIPSEEYLIQKRKTGTLPSCQPLQLACRMLFSNDILTMSTMIMKREYLDAIIASSAYDSQFDWVLFTQVAQRTLFYKIPEELVNWRVHSLSYHHQTIIKQNFFKYRLNKIKTRFYLFRLAFTVRDPNDKVQLLIWVMKRMLLWPFYQSHALLRKTFKIIRSMSNQ